MTTPDETTPAATDPHARLGTVASFLMGAASVVHDAAAYYLKAQHSALLGELETARHAAAALAHGAYHLGRFHATYGVPVPDDVVASAAQLLPDTVAELEATNRATAPARVDDPAAAAAVVDEPAAAVDDLEHQGAERVDEPDELEHQGAAQ